HIYIKHIGQMEDEAVVVSVFDHSFDVLLLKSGVIARVYVNQLPVRFEYETFTGGTQLVLTWFRDEKNVSNRSSDQLVQIIRACKILNVLVSVSSDDQNKLNVSHYITMIYKYYKTIDLLGNYSASRWTLASN